MGIFIGNQKMKPLGIDKIYVGNNLVYQSGPNIVAKLTPTAGKTYSTDISDWTTEDMKLISGAISNNADITSDTSVVYVDYLDNKYYKLSCELNTYTKKSMNIGSSYDFAIIGFNHDDLATPTYYGATTATGKAGITWQMERCLSSSYKMNTTRTNVGGWTNSTMRTSTMPTLFNSFEFSNAVASALKRTSEGNKSTNINIDTDTFFLLSEIEVFGIVTASQSGEGQQYKWYKNGNTEIKTIRYNYWWERSPAKENNTMFCYIDSTAYPGRYYADTNNYVSIAFCS